MAATATAEVIREPVLTRRFDRGDLSRHGPWMLPRLVEACGISEQMAAGWLQSFLFSNEHMFLFQNHAVALAQAVPGYGLKNQLVVQERFVWVEDKEAKQQIKDAAEFYDHFYEWAKLKGAEQLIAMEYSDVPQSLVEERLGRLFKFETRYARIK